MTCTLISHIEKAFSPSVWLHQSSSTSQKHNDERLISVTHSPQVGRAAEKVVGPASTRVHVCQIDTKVAVEF